MRGGAYGSAPGVQRRASEAGVGDQEVVSRRKGFRSRSLTGKGNCPCHGQAIAG